MFGIQDEYKGEKNDYFLIFSQAWSELNLQMETQDRGETEEGVAPNLPKKMCST